MERIALLLKRIEWHQDAISELRLEIAELKLNKVYVHKTTCEHKLIVQSDSKTQAWCYKCMNTVAIS